MKVDKGMRGGRGHQRLIKKILNVNIFNFAKVDKGGRGKTLAYPPKKNNLPVYFYNPSRRRLVGL